MMTTTLAKLSLSRLRIARMDLMNSPLQPRSDMLTKKAAKISIWSSRRNSWQEETARPPKITSPIIREKPVVKLKLISEKDQATLAFS